MSKLTAVLVTAAIVFPLGVFAAGPLKGHPNLLKAQRQLNQAAADISASQSANECIWGLEGGHGQKAKEAIDAAKRQIDDAANWINEHANECAKKR